jgi:hypothetical protein
MINYDSILSIFNDKGTLLKYLKKVENALKTSVLTKCEVLKGNDNYFAFKFNFADDTSITTEYVKIDPDLQATNLQNYINGSDTIVVDLNELQTALVVKLDEEYKKSLATQTDVENLTSRVDNHYTLIKKLEQITDMKQNIITDSVDIVKKDNKLYISDAVTKVTTDLKAQADTNTSNIATNTSNIATNTSNIATNTSNIATNTSNIATNTNDITSLKSSKQDTLTSGTNIKTINGESVLGSGDLTISGGTQFKGYTFTIRTSDDGNDGAFNGIVIGEFENIFGMHTFIVNPNGEILVDGNRSSEITKFTNVLFVIFTYIKSSADTFRRNMPVMNLYNGTTLSTFDGFYNNINSLLYLTMDTIAGNED